MQQFDLLESKRIQTCQICHSRQLTPLLFLGYVSPVNHLQEIRSAPEAEVRFPLDLLRCEECLLMQIGYIVDARIIFPATYPYLSGTTRILRDNFAQLAEEAVALLSLTPSDLVIDIGANDGTLLKPFKDRKIRTLGIEPSQAADHARRMGIPMIQDYFRHSLAKKVRAEWGQARVITAANVFAHMNDVHDVVEGIRELLLPGGVFISESHYLMDLLDQVQYDTIYHEHLRYYSLHTLRYLFSMHELEIFRVQRIPTHGGSIRVYAARPGEYAVDSSVDDMLSEEYRRDIQGASLFQTFRSRILQAKRELLTLLYGIKARGEGIYGIGAPSRSSTLIHYTGLDDHLIDAIVEVSSSHKLNKFVPGTRIPIVDESCLYRDQPENALIFSWHIADEIATNVRSKGFRGKFITPLPQPAFLSEES